MLSSVRVDLLLNSRQCHSGEVLHLLQDVNFKVRLTPALLHKLLEFLKRQHITILVIPILRTIFLNGVICQVNEIVIEIRGIHRVGLT